MTELVVVAFEDETSAVEMRDALVRLQEQGLIALDDAAVAIRKPDGSVRVKQAVSLVGEGALGGAFWGLFIWVLFWMPWLGMRVDGLPGASGDGPADVGLDDGFVKEVQNTLKPGHSALFLLIRKAVPDKVVDELVQFNGRILHTSLSREDEARLREAFGADEERSLDG